MKTFLSDLIPKFQKYSHKIDNLALLTNQHWVVIDDIDKSKNVYIFRDNNELLISHNGTVEKAKWEYLGNNSLLIDRKNKSYLFKQGFFDENILALKIDGKQEYAFFVNETKFDGELNSINKIFEFLNLEYIESPIQKVTHNSSDQFSYEIKSDNINNPMGFDIKKVEEVKNKYFNIEHHYVEFDDGIKGYIFVENGQIFFKEKKLWRITKNHYYKDLNLCVNALHYFIRTELILKEGLIYTK